MSETKWTPGPWARGKVGGLKSPRTERRIPHSSAWVTNAWCDRDATAESMANDHLIAAAPQLYEALDRMLKVFVEDLAECGYDEDDIADHDNVKAALSALAAARGEKP